MKNILILGGFGFIGTNIIKYIDLHFVDKYNLIIFDKYPYHPHSITFKSVSKLYDGDFTDELLLEKIFNENRIDIVLHLISSTVPLTSQNAKFDIISNLIPTLNLLNIMVKYNVTDIIYFSSGGAIYGEQKNAHSENDSILPKSSYAIVKHTIERYLMLYADLYNFNSLILRLSNPYGCYHFNNYQGICNIAIRKGLKNEHVQIWGDGNGHKDYIFIEDVCCILMKFVDNKISKDIINLGSGESYSVNEIIEVIKNKIPNIKTEYINKSKTDVTNSSLNIEKLKSFIGNFQFTNFKQGIDKTFLWEKSVFG
jgi:UDP-glucose 4-epimerase